MKAIIDPALETFLNDYVSKHRKEELQSGNLDPLTTPTFYIGLNSEEKNLNIFKLLPQNFVI